MTKDTESQAVALTDFLLARIAERKSAITYAYETGNLSFPILSPAEMLADLDAKRAIVERHATSGNGGCYICAEFERGSVPCVEQRILASVYADHPDYREEWRP